ncbi:MAG: hypothetical protein K1X94_00400 [Sandaracinaceae bacterium]|nr:hypothetical protein [Sandaracinaceae bacterium]
MLGIGIGEAVVILVITAVCGAPVLALIVMFALTVIDTVRQKGRWGINLAKTTCPSCGTPAPTFRRPASFEEAMWGGWTCATCSLRIDKWGRPRDEAPPPYR